MPLDNDVDEFFAEQEKCMNLPDEDMDAYIRMRLQGCHSERLKRKGVEGHQDPPDDKRMRTEGMPDIVPITFTCVTRDHDIPLHTSTPASTMAENVAGHLSNDLSHEGAMLRNAVLEVSKPLNTSDLGTALGDRTTMRMQRQSQPCVQGLANASAVLDFKCGSEMAFNTSLSPKDSATKPIPEATSSQEQEFDLSHSRSRFRVEIPQIVELPHSPVNISEVIVLNVIESPSTGSKTYVIPTEKLPHRTRGKRPRTNESSDRSLNIPPHQSRDSDISQIALPSPATLPSPSDVRLVARPPSVTEKREVQRLSTPSPGIKPPQLDTDLSNITSPGLSPAHERFLKKAGSDVPDAEKPSSSRSTCTAAKVRRTVNSRQKVGSTSKGSKKGKEKPALVTPLEYALKLQSNMLPVTPKTSYLMGKCIFYVGGDMQYASTRTRGRMEYIIKHGGTLAPKYDQAVVTHIVTDTGPHITLRALSLKSLSEIPDHIPTVTWSWVLSGYGRATNGNGKLITDKKGNGKARDVDDRDEEEQLLDFEFMHAAFPQRIDAGRQWNKHAGRKAKQGQQPGSRIPNASPSIDVNDDVSRISDFSQERRKEVVVGCSDVAKVLPPPPLNLQPNERPSRIKSGPPAILSTRKAASGAPEGADDPLAEYYAQAKAQREAEWTMDESESDDGDEGFEFRKENVQRQGFTCDQKEPQRTTCANQDIIEKLWKMSHENFACIRALRNYPKQITSFNEARSIRGVGEKTALKIMEIINTGDLRRIEHERTDGVEVTRLFQGIYGVGRSTAFAWYASGHRTLDDIKANSKSLRLSPAQEIGLKFYDALEIDKNLFIGIMGSYRRGKADCGDIDILARRFAPPQIITTHDNTLGVLSRLLDRLQAAKILTEDLALPANPAELELTYRGLCKLPDPGAKRRRIDILCVPWKSRGAALLYYTGDDIFNRAMRLKANVMGYSLNQRGLYGGVVRDPQNRRVKLSDAYYTGSIIASETEEEIFQILGK
ncbi:hypothetical protein F5J12DRAFT_783656 [Pisolithus orientalis]|uniref:uncharacterized protein n=1 Tax=Pisolithus orientalis TaxID=936130 RepID=UPI002224D7D0|nr:uncharacterized protein F5J12DRAFT_783656 [Pisolithus orientalis]KAI6003223.1 hypothetical protein F5J12DRAFT_783656 [Pisolithus orientalis]